MLISDRSIHLDLSTWRIACNAEGKSGALPAQGPRDLQLSAYETTWGTESRASLGIGNTISHGQNFDPRRNSKDEYSRFSLPFSFRRKRGRDEDIGRSRKKGRRKEEFSRIGRSSRKDSRRGSRANIKFGLRGHGDRDSAATALFSSIRAAYIYIHRVKRIL